MSKKVLEIIMDAVKEISEKFKDEPLDADEVDLIAQRFRAELDLNQGNITRDEYNKEYGVKAWEMWFREKQ